MVVPLPLTLLHVNVAPIRVARACIPASPRWPAGTWDGSKPLPSSSMRSRTPDTRPTHLDADLPGSRVLHDVVERLLGDAVQGLLDRQREPLVAERALDHDRQPDPALEGRGMGLERPSQAVLLEVPGPELEDERPHLREGLALQLAQLGHLGPGRLDVAVQQQLDGPRDEGHREQRLGDRVVELAREMGPLLAGRQLARLATQVALEAVAVADVPGRAMGPDERAVGHHADAVDLDQDVVAVRVPERQPRALDRRRMA